jgi:hypothetical protein
MAEERQIVISSPRAARNGGDRGGRGDTNVNVKPKTTLLRRCLSLRETLEDLLGLGKKEEATEIGGLWE